MTGAKTYIGKGDRDMVEKGILTWAEHFDAPYQEAFKPDVLLEDGDHVSLGETDILCLSTPGHTEGTLSFFFDVTDGEETFRAGMHGGVGLNTLNAKYMKENGIPEEMRERFFAGIERLKGERVEIFLGNHVGNNDTAGKLARVAAGEKNAFICPEEWIPFLNARAKELNDLMAKEEREALV